MPVPLLGPLWPPTKLSLTKGLLDTADRTRVIPAFIHLALEAGQWWAAFSAEDPDVTLPGQDSNAAIERIAEDLRHLSAEPLAERMLGAETVGWPNR